MPAPYDIYPAVDAQYNFPPEVRSQIAKATEVLGAISAYGDPQFAQRPALNPGNFINEVPYVAEATDFAVSAVSGQRQVTVAAGSAFGMMNRYTSGSAQTLTIPTPASGNAKWFAVCLNWQWNPSVTGLTPTVTMTVDDLNVTVTDQTLQAFPTTAAFNAGGALPNSPGVVGTGRRQVLAYVFARNQDTSMSIFDARYVRTGSGIFEALTFAGLIHAIRQNLVIEGGLMSVAPHTVKSGGTHSASLWQRVRVSGQFEPVGRITTNNTGASGRSARDDITDYASAGGGFNVPEGTYLWDTLDRIQYRWNLTSWVWWSSDWKDWSSFATDLGNGGTGNPNKKGRYRFIDGLIRVEVHMTVPSSGFTWGSYLRMAMPFNCESGTLASSEAIVTVVYQNASDSYRRYYGFAYFDSGNTVRFTTIGLTNNSVNPGATNDITNTAPFNEAWGSDDRIHIAVEYLPA